MKYVNAKAVRPHGRNMYRPDISISRPGKTSTRPGASKAAAAGNWQSGTPESWMLTGRGYPWRNWGISTAYLSMPYGKLYIRSKRQGAAARGSLFLRVGEADAGNIVQNSTEENSRLHIHFPGDRIESSEIRKEVSYHADI